MPTDLKHTAAVTPKQDTAKQHAYQHLLNAIDSLISAEAELQAAGLPFMRIAVEHNRIDLYRMTHRISPEDTPYDPVRARIDADLAHASPAARYTEAEGKS